MKILQQDKLLHDYFDYCKYEKNLNDKTIKAYGTDLRQFRTFFAENENDIDKYAIREELIIQNSFERIETHMKEEKELPKIVTRHTVEQLLSYMYRQYKDEELTIGDI